MKKEEQLSINLSPEVATGKYANMAVIAHGPEEFIMDFIAMLPNMPQAQVVARVVQTPANTKKLLYALQENISKYEKMYGTIDLGQSSPVPGSTLPISFGGGEA